MSLIKNNPYYQKPEVASKVQGYSQAANAVTLLLPEESNPYAYDKSSVWKGAGQGAAAGSMIMPGIGTAVGAVVGAIGGGVGAALKQRNALDNTDTSFQTLQYDEYGQPVFQGGELSQGLSNLDNINKAWDKTHGGKDWDFNVRRLRKTRNALSQGIERSQDQFNEANIAYSRNLLARQQYEDEMKKNNIYNFPMQLV